MTNFDVPYGFVVSSGASSCSGDSFFEEYTVADEEKSIFFTQKSCITPKSVIDPEILFS